MEDTVPSVTSADVPQGCTGTTGRLDMTTQERAELWAAHSSMGDSWERSRPKAELEAVMMLATMQRELTESTSIYANETLN